VHELTPSSTDSPITIKRGFSVPLSKAFPVTRGTLWASASWRSTDKGVAPPHHNFGVYLRRRSMAGPNKSIEPTPSSVRCAPASGRGSCPALGFKGNESRNSDRSVARSEHNTKPHSPWAPIQRKYRTAISRFREFAMGTAPLNQEHQGPVGSIAASLQCFTGSSSALVSGAPWWDTSGALPYKALQPTPWNAFAFPRPLVRCG
jgi:hypothetical protein